MFLFVLFFFFCLDLQRVWNEMSGEVWVQSNERMNKRNKIRGNYLKSHSRNNMLFASSIFYSVSPLEIRWSVMFGRFMKNYSICVILCELLLCVRAASLSPSRCVSERVSWRLFHFIWNLNKFTSAISFSLFNLLSECL